MTRWLFLICCAALKTCQSYLLIQSPGALHVSVGETFTIKCIHELEVKYCYYTTVWHKVNMRTGELVQTKNLQPNFETPVNSKICTLTISNATIKDSGMYYCSGQHGTMSVFGNGTRVIVTGGAELNLSISLSSVVGVSGPVVPLQCVVMGAVPSQVQVSWMVAGREFSGWTESGWTEDSDSAEEFTRAHLSLSAEEWRTSAQDIQCVVQYQDKTVSKLLQRTGTDVSLCSWLLYLGFGAAVLTITVTITVTVCLHKERQRDKIAKGYRNRNTQSMQQTQGKRDTLKPAAEKPSYTEVEYSCLNPDSFNQHLNTNPPSEIQ